MSNRQHGYVLIALLTTVSFIAVAAIAVASLASNNLRTITSDHYRLAAQLAADGGIDKSLGSLNNDLLWEPTPDEIEVQSNAKFRTTYSAELSEIAVDGVSRTLTVTGRTYAPAAHPAPVSERTYRVKLRAVKAGSFSLVSGVGGLIMENSAKVIGGNVHINGDLQMSNSAQIGLTTNPVNVTVSHHNCPIGGGASYPALCPPGASEPISITNPAWIYGNVRTTNQSDMDVETLERMSNDGLMSSGNVPIQELPSHDRDAQKAAVTSEISGAAASCTSNGGTTTWDANTKINGDVTVSKKCTVTVLGDIWITGDLELSNSGTIRLENGISDPPVIMVDGDGGVSSKNSGSFESNNIFRGFRVITYHSAASCSPDCTDVTGQDLYNSRNMTTILLTQTASGPNTEFYARWTKVEMGNSGGIGALVGQTVHLTNSAAVTFGVEVSGINSINGWVIQSYQRVYP